MAAALLVRRGGLTPEQQVAVGRIASSAGRMASLIQDVLDFARARQGLGMSLRREPTDVAAICRTAVQEFGWIRPDAPPTLSVEGETEAPVDRTRLAQALSNLLANALQHGGAAPVSVSVRGESRHVVCEVHNGGAPIPPEVLPHLFEPFRRGPRAADPGGSLGLGLFIVHEIVRGHGGAVEVESTAEAGTTFTLRLPRA
jgi:signal transduction histidine kinase